MDESNRTQAINAINPMKREPIILPLESRELTAALDVVAAALEAVEAPEEDAIPVIVVFTPLEFVSVVLAAAVVEFPDPDVAVAKYSVVVNEQDRTRSFASLSLPSLLNFEIQASHSGKLFAARGSLQMQFNSAVSSSLVLLSQEDVRLTTGAQTSLH